ncbi:alkaline phosphatase family protein [Leucobacter allii]|uniref:Alkaline phosphatase family protein n=1 Tax=Leucobacter allii TaxID=2932247 RepID=A0ABY4FR10_9MICO|nr:alkaline phosphatase family protein [Leucobacter allii]UOQ58619.1 alkaline phosphatase family protein [Leucobacter allii]
MLPTASDNGARLAAILPSGIAAVAAGLGGAAPELVADAVGARADAAKLPPLRAFVLVVVDGLGHANLQASAGHAPTLARLQRRRIETVAPSTTGAALTTLTTGALPGEHGLVGYRIRHPELGLVSTLKDWAGISDRRAWQRVEPLFGLARRIGVRPVAIGRPAHAVGGLTEAILTGADYVPGQRIEDRFAAASALLREGEAAVVYLYVDELDKAAHASGWRSEAWLRGLEQFDGALAGFLRGLPGGVGVAVTADHGIVDVAEHQQRFLDADPERFARVALVGGEPRLRSLYLADDVDPEAEARAWAAAEGPRAWVATRAEAVASGWFGPVAPEVAPRLGDVLIAARKQLAYYTAADSAEARAMIGQHGAFSEEERGVPLAIAGALDGTGFASAVAGLAAARGAR